MTSDNGPSEDLCIFHTYPDKEDFSRTLKFLKGRVIPGRIAKRAGYLVCNCNKKHTSLDDAFQKLNLKDVGDKISEKLQTETESTANQSDRAGQENEKIVETTSEQETPDEVKVNESSQITTDNGDRTVADPLVTGHPEPVIPAPVTGHPEPPVYPALLTAALTPQGDGVSTGYRRLVAMAHMCLTGDLSALEPRKLHQEKVEQFRKLNQRPYFRKVKKKKPKYSVVREFVLSRPLINISDLIGRQGKNIKTMTGSTDCRLSVTPALGCRGDIQITVRAKGTEDYLAVQRRVQVVYSSLKTAFWQYQKRKRERAERLAAMYGDERGPGRRRRNGSSRWYLDEEIKESARDKFEKKSSYRLSRKASHSVKPGVLDQGSRCLNCLAPYDKTATGTDQCSYHPGFYAHGSWTCCDVLDDDGDKCHRITGCTTTRHNWRPSKAVRCSSRKLGQQRYTGRYLYKA